MSDKVEASEEAAFTSILTGHQAQSVGLPPLRCEGAAHVPAAAVETASAQRGTKHHARHGLLRVVERGVERPNGIGEPPDLLGALGRTLAGAVEAVWQFQCRAIAALSPRVPLVAGFLAGRKRRAELSLDGRPQPKLLLI